MSKPRIKPPAPPDLVVVEILLCTTHGYYAVAIDDRRVTPDKCCGSWKTLRSWATPRAGLVP